MLGNSIEVELADMRALGSYWQAFQKMAKVSREYTAERQKGEGRKVYAARVLYDIDGGERLLEPGWLVIVEVQDNERLLVDNLPSSS
ncbi:uncharacterized protein Bfra_004721 [Botrytis fragariae]|uniref:Uncharacterized protein n=1 Tax=Botrytis fragariae TaxID=1964551 RepID=A0A8H6AVX4_9HELO|nr:uncharacterized protein Bfra_004721 [Botrytis fragariae]KAF5874706.1 hypothetical protein Bfra_004721 [Botrytis fragariae]